MTALKSPDRGSSFSTLEGETVMTADTFTVQGTERNKLVLVTVIDGSGYRLAL